MATAVASFVVAASVEAAAPPQFEARVSSDAVALDQPVRLEVTLVRDAGQVYQSFSRPEPKDFDVLSQAESESTQWTIANGTQSTRTIEQHVYMLRARHKGSCVIPPAVARIDGREWKTRELVIKVSAPGAMPSGAEPVPPAPASSPEGMRGDEDCFVDARADKTTAYVGEQVIATWTLYCRAQVLHYRTTAEPKHDDFWSEELYMPPNNRLAWEQQVINGQEYISSLLLRRALFPLRSGKLVVSPLEQEVTTMQTAMYAMASAVRGSKPITIEVLPLPALGRPDGFETPNVGRYEVTASVDNTHPKAGDAITWRVLVRGKGNLTNLKLHKLDHLDGFKLYEPSLSDTIQRTEHGVEGQKLLTYLLLPRKGGELSIPPFELSFFDPSLKKYETATTAGVNVTVSGDPEKIGIGTQETKENLLAPKIRPLRSGHHVETHLGERVLRGPALLVALVVPPMCLLSIVLGSALRARLRRETEWSKRRRARAAARRRMKACELHIKGQRPSQFFAECARALYEHLEYRLGMKMEAFTVEQLRQALVDRGFPGEVARSITNELEACDFARFAASASGTQEMRSALRRVGQLLSKIERMPTRDSGSQVAA